MRSIFAAKHVTLLETAVSPRRTDALSRPPSFAVPRATGRLAGSAEAGL